MLSEDCRHLRVTHTCIRISCTAKYWLMEDRISWRITDLISKITALWERITVNVVPLDHLQTNWISDISIQSAKPKRYVYVHVWTETFIVLAQTKNVSLTPVLLKGRTDLWRTVYGRSAQEILALLSRISSAGGQRSTSSSPGDQISRYSSGNDHSSSITYSC